MDKDSKLNNKEVVDIAKELGDELTSENIIKPRWGLSISDEDAKSVGDGWVESNFFTDIEMSNNQCTMKGSTTALAYVPSKGDPSRTTKVDTWAFTGVGITSITASPSGVTVTGGLTSKTATRTVDHVTNGYTLSYYTIKANASEVLSVTQSTAGTFYYGSIDYNTMAAKKAYL